MPRNNTAQALAALLLLTAPAAADIVVLYNGKWYEGTIKSENQDRVVMDTLVSGIRSEMTFERRNITSIERKPLPEGFFESRKPAPSSSSEPAPVTPAEPSTPSSPAAATSIQYCVIPIEGEFGKDVFPAALAGVLAECREQAVQHVILRIKSPGGAVWVAQEMAEILQSQCDGMQVHAVIEDALSAAIWPVFASNTVWVLPGSRVGAAVVFRQDNTTGAAEVDAKLNSAIAAGLANIAVRRGHLPLLARAMILPEARVYCYTENDKPVIAGDPPPGAGRKTPGFRVIDDERSILTLTSAEAVEVGLARSLDAFDLTALRDSLGIAEWSAAKVPAEATLRRYTEASRALTSQIEQVAEDLVSHINAANKADPYRYRYTVTKEGRFTEDSQRRWSELSGECTDEWNHVKRLLQRFQGLQKKAADLKVTPFTDMVAKEKIRTTVSEIDARLEKLRKERTRTRPPAEFNSVKP